MAVVHTCDVCKVEKPQLSLLKLKVGDGESHHNGDLEETVIDICPGCLRTTMDREKTSLELFTLATSGRAYYQKDDLKKDPYSHATR